MHFNKIEDEGIIAIARGLSNLKKLRVSNCFIGPSGIIVVAENLKQLEYLDISNNKVN